MRTEHVSTCGKDSKTRMAVTPSPHFSCQSHTRDRCVEETSSLTGLARTIDKTWNPFLWGGRQPAAPEPQVALLSWCCGSVWLGKIHFKYPAEAHFICVSFVFIVVVNLTIIVTLKYSNKILLFSTYLSRLTTPVWRNARQEKYLKKIEY